MTHRSKVLPAILLLAGLVSLPGCAGFDKREAADEAAPIPPPPGTGASATPGTPRATKKKTEDLPDRVFAPLDDTVNVINRDINRDLDKEFPENKNNPPPSSDN